jgi:hypothetical protein
MSTYRTAKEIKSVINNENRIEGLVEVTLGDIEKGCDYLTDVIVENLIGDEYGYLLEDVGYEIHNCNIKKQTIQLEISADASSLLVDDDWLSEFEN